jgi:plastocyanin
MRIRPLTASAAALTATVLVTGAVAVSGSQAATTKTVRVDDYSFSPKVLTVKAGTKVKFVWVGTAKHDIELNRAPRRVKDPRSFDSRIMTRGSVTRTFKEPGTYAIDCSIHFSIMRMTVKVKK